MATPSSSTTTPSPPMLPMLPQQSIISHSFLNHDQQRPVKSMQNFLARAELSTVTRALRARLSYASFKASNNMSHVPLGDLEAQSSPAPVSTPTRGNKRKAAGGNQYGNPTTPTTAGTDRKNALLQSHAGPSTNVKGGGYAYPHSSIGANTVADAVTLLRQQGASKNLYTSLLTPPPAKIARTIHNPRDPPVTAASPARRPSKPSSKASSRPGPTRSIAEGTRAQAKSRQKSAATSTSKKSKSSSSRSKGERGQSSRKGKERAVGRTKTDRDGDVDMQAAATTLASLLMNKRPTAGGSVSSTRSSISSDSASQPLAQKLASTNTEPALSQETVASASSAYAHDRRKFTPPPQSIASHLTPRPSVGPSDDTEAADLMLFLATSPSPVRPTTAAEKEARDSAAFRALSGVSRLSGLREKGRILFSNSHGSDDASSSTDNLRDKTLKRSAPGEASFTSSISSIGGDMRGEGGLSPTKSSNGQISRQTSAATSPFISPQSSQNQLLPPPPSPGPRKAVVIPSPLVDRDYPPAPPSGPRHSSRTPTGPWASPYGGSEGARHHPGSVNATPFNLSEFISVSPYPGSHDGERSPPAHPTPKGSLRADVGRKLFEEEQMRHHHLHPTNHNHYGQPQHAVRPSKTDLRGLGSSIDIIQG